MNRNPLIPDTKTEPRAKGTSTVQVDTKETNLYENDGGNKNGVENVWTSRLLPPSLCVTNKP